MFLNINQVKSEECYAHFKSWFDGLLCILFVFSLNRVTWVLIFLYKTHHWSNEAFILWWFPGETFTNIARFGDHTFPTFPYKNTNAPVLEELQTNK